MRPRRRMRLLSALILSALALSVLVLSACAKAPARPGPDPGSGEGTDPVAMIQAASGRAMDAGALHLTFRMTISAGGQEMTGTGEGDVSLHDLKQDITFRFDGVPELPGGISMEMILDGHLVYMRSSAFAGVPGLDTDWVSMDLNDIAPGLGSLATLGTGQNDPSTAFGFLRGVDDAQAVGTEEIDGVQTTHYRGTLSLQDAMNRLPSKLRSTYRTAMSKLHAEVGDVSIPFDVWVDDGGLLRRMSYRVASGAGPDPIGAFSMQTTIDVTKYSDHLTLELPPKRDVTDLAGLT